MKLVFFGDNKLGLIKDKTVVDLSGLVGEINAPTPQDLINTVISEFDSRYRARFLLEAESATGIPIRDANLHAPLPRPGQIVAMAANYLEDGALKEPRPINAFFKSPESVIGNGDTVVIPPSPATIFHHEAELGIVIGRVAENVPADQADQYIFGYVNFIDVSARGLGGVSFYWGKSWDTFGPMGPYLVTADEIEDHHNLQVKLWVNNQLRQNYNTSDMGHKIPRIIEWASSIVRLEPGDLVICGTNHQGLGAVQDGDSVEIETEGLGKLRVSVQDKLKRAWPNGIDKEVGDRVAGRK